VEAKIYGQPALNCRFRSRPLLDLVYMPKDVALRPQNPRCFSPRAADLSTGGDDSLLVGSLRGGGVRSTGGESLRGGSVRSSLATLNQAHSYYRQKLASPRNAYGLQCSRLQTLQSKS